MKTTTEESAALEEFCDARDELLNSNLVDDLESRLERLRKSNHPEALYICSLLGHKKFTRRLDILHVLEPHAVTCPIVACYYGMLLPESNTEWIKRSAKQGFAYAQVQRSWINLNFKYANAAADQGDRTGMFLLAKCYENGRDVEMDKKRAGLLYRRSAYLGFKHAMIWCAQYGYCDFAFEIIYFYGRVAQKGGQAWYFLDVCTNGPITCVMGYMLKGHVTTKNAFNYWLCDSTMIAVNKALDLHTRCKQAHQQRTLTWLMISKRLGICRDVARLIGTLLLHPTYCPQISP